MKAIGKLATLVLMMAAAGAAVIGVRSLPDIKRYLKMRDM